MICPAHNFSKKSFQGSIRIVSTILGNGSVQTTIAFFTSYSSLKAFNPDKCFDVILLEDFISIATSLYPKIKSTSICVAVLQYEMRYSKPE